jgi:hypothetical protein
MTKSPPLASAGTARPTNDDASRYAYDGNIEARRTDSRSMQVQSKSRCWLRNPWGNRNNTPNRRRVPRTQGRARRWGRTHKG